MQWRRRETGVVRWPLGRMVPAAPGARWSLNAHQTLFRAASERRQVRLEAAIGPRAGSTTPLRGTPSHVSKFACGQGLSRHPPADQSHSAAGFSLGGGLRRSSARPASGSAPKNRAYARDLHLVSRFSTSPDLNAHSEAENLRKRGGQRAQQARICTMRWQVASAGALPQSAG